MIERDLGDSAAKVNAFYEPLASAQSAARRVGWESDAAHLLRLRALADALAPLGALAEVRDIGCGEGRLLSVLRGRGYSGRYVGEDVLSMMVKRAQNAFPAERFIQRDAFLDGPSGDALVCSGLLNTPQHLDHQASAHALLKTLWERTTKVCAIDFATLGEHPPRSHTRAIDLHEMWSFARTLTPLVSVREDILTGEALLVLRRSRRPLLEAFLPEECWAIERARMLLAAREPEAVRATLTQTHSDEGRVWQALADLMTGRARAAEEALRALSSHPTLRPRALLHLGVVLLATHRGTQAEQVLREAAETQSSAADEARVVLAERAQQNGDRAQAQRWIKAIGDPWMRRELSAED